MQEIESYRKEHALENLIVRGYFAREQLADSLTLGDVHLASLRPEMAGVAVPSKLYGIMAAGRPVIFVGPEACETAEAIRAADCGRVFAPDDADGLEQCLRALADHRDELATLGTNARRAFDTTYSPAVCCTQWRELLESLVE